MYPATIAAADACKEHNAGATKTIIRAARRASTEFDMPEYIDLYSFYVGIFSKIKRTSPKSYIILNGNQRASTKPTKEFQKALDVLKAVSLEGIQILSKVVLHNASGQAFPHAKGLAIYYPTTRAMHSSYQQTLFAQDTHWIDFIREYR